MLNKNRFTPIPNITTISKPSSPIYFNIFASIDHVYPKCTQKFLRIFPRWEVNQIKCIPRWYTVFPHLPDRRQLTVPTMQMKLPADQRTDSSSNSCLHMYVQHLDNKLQVRTPPLLSDLFIWEAAVQYLQMLALQQWSSPIAIILSLLWHCISCYTVYTHRLYLYTGFLTCFTVIYIYFCTYQSLIYIFDVQYIHIDCFWMTDTGVIWVGDSFWSFSIHGVISSF